MKFSLRKTVMAGLAAGGIALAPLALSHFDDKEPNQSYRQSWFTLTAMNFGPMASMVKGEMPWDDAMMKGFAADLEAVTQLNLMRAFGPGTDKGTTRAKPEIWSNMDDFQGKLEDFQQAASALNAAAQGGDRKAIAAAVGNTGKACKACHDEYKSKEYLY